MTTECTDFTYSISSDPCRPRNPWLNRSCGTLLASLEPGRAQCGVELAKVFRQFGGPGHARTGLVRVFEAENFGVQGLTREIYGRVCVILAAIGGVIRAIADQGQSGVGSLDANLMFS